MKTTKNNKTITIKLSIGEYWELMDIVDNGFDNGEFIKGYGLAKNDKRFIDHHNVYKKVLHQATKTN
tara:strand:+ start:506 stop:706 length:201 start_codon:yes stop_codon:yes gene_type:complete